LNQPKPAGGAYQELVEADEHGHVRQIERHYGTDRAHRSVSLTAQPRLASRWREAADLRGAKHSVRELLTHGDFDRQQARGIWFDVRDHAPSSAFLEALIARWPAPERALTGLQPVQEGVWRPTGQDEPVGTMLVGPLW